MLVKELLTESLSRANWIEDNFPAEASQLEKAKKYFDSALRKFSDSNLITAFQKDLNLTLSTNTSTIGKPVYKDRVLIHICHYPSDEPSATLPKFVVGRDYLVTDYAVGTNLDKHAKKLVSNGGVKSWEACDESEFSKWIPNVICNDMERIVSIKCKNDFGRWETVDFTSFNDFYGDDREYLYCHKPCGENCTELLITDKMKGKDLKVIYNSSMKFGKNDTINLPEAHIELLTLETTIGILTEDQDSDPTQLNNYIIQRDDLAKQIKANSSSQRTITRQVNYQYNRLNDLYTGAFIYR